MCFFFNLIKVFAGFTPAFALQSREKSTEKRQSGQPKSASYHDEDT
jgi:hypothetical protein